MELESRCVILGNAGDVPLELHRGQHPQGTVPPLAVVEDLQVLEDSARQLHSSTPFLAIKKLCLHSSPERLDDCVVVGRANSAHGWHASGLPNLLREHPGGELAPSVRVHDASRRWSAIV